MAKCVYCNQKKGKRPCPSLDGSICTLCCGEHRDKEIRCASTCNYKTDKQTYYTHKEEPAFYAHSTAFFTEVMKKHGDKGKHLLGYIDVKLYECFYNKDNNKDAEVISLFNSLRSKLSPLELVSQQDSPIAQLAWEGMDEFLKYISVNNETAIDIIDSYIKRINDYIEDDDTLSGKWIKQFLYLMETKNAPVCQRVREGAAEDAKEKNKVIYPGSTPANNIGNDAPQEEKKSSIIITDI